MNALISRATFTALFVLTLQGSLATAQNHTQKEAAIRGRVHLEIPQFVSEIDRAQAIHEVHTLIFESKASSYFGRNALVRKIVLENMSLQSGVTQETLDDLTNLRAHSLYYPTRYNAVDTILAKLEDESITHKNLIDVTRGLLDESPNLNITFASETASRDVNSNLSRLALLTNFDAILTAREDILRALKGYRSFQIMDSPEQYGVSGFFANSGAANLVVGRTERFNSKLYIDIIALEKLLHIGMIKGFSVKPGYFQEASVFESAISELLQVVSDPRLVNRLRAHGVRGFEIDEHYKNREHLFKHGILVVGTTAEEIKDLIDLLVP